MFNAIIVDDEKPALDVLKRVLEKTGEICVVGSYMSAAAALSELQRLKPDVAFLDIEMSEMSGLELAEKIIDADCNIEIIFVTAYDKYALEAFRVNAIDYLLKPLSSADVAQTITRLKKRRPLTASPEKPADQGSIYCFGKLLVYSAGCENPVKWRTSKAEELFAFMLQNRNDEVSKWKITQTLWPEYETEKLNVYLHTTVYQVKKTLLSAKIKFDLTFTNGRYKLELPDVYIDVVEFEAITDASTTFTTASIERYTKALGLYKGNYLDENEYLWSQNKAEEYSNRYRGLVLKLADYYLIQTDYPTAEKILQKALAIIPLDDDINVMLLKLYSMKNDKASLVLHYNKIKELYKIELGITPSAAMQALLNNITKL